MSSAKTKTPLVTMVVGAVLTLMSAPCVAAAIHDLVTGAKNQSGALIMGVFFAIILTIGIGSFRWGWKSRNAVPATELSREREQQALKTIGSLGGEVTVAQLAMKTDLSVKEATEFLADLERQGIAHSWVTDEGAISFRIPHLTGRHDAVNADDYVFDLAVENEDVSTEVKVAD